MKTAVFTIASKNYFAYVKTLMQSLETSNPHMDRFAVVVDELDDDFVSIPFNFNLLTLDELKLPHPNCFKFRYDIMEFNTAVKPYAILRLFDSYDRVIYLDPDIYVYEKLQPVEDALDEGDNFVFTPHFSDMFEDDGCKPDYPDIMRVGTYNLGFIALNRCDDAVKMVSWWANMLERQCISDQRNGIFVDQKWMDLVPGFFEHVRILHHSGLNVAYWNLSHRMILKKDGKFFVNGKPLIFFHFSGLDVKNIRKVSKHQDRFMLKDLGDGGELFEVYSKKVLSNKFDMWKKFEYSFDHYSDGSSILKEHREKYRSSKMLQGYCGENPFLFANIFYGREKMHMQSNGVNLLGYLSSEHGLGEAVRLTANCLTDAEVNWTGIDFEIGNSSRKRDTTYKNKIEDYIKYNISILNVNADQFPVLKNNTPKELWDTYKIAIWYWELPEFPWEWMKAFIDVDEIWAPTRFIYDCLKKCSPCPVFYMPPGIYRKTVDTKIYTRTYFGLPEKTFLFFNMFDVYSFSERKNPEAAVKAFQQSFSASDMSVGLVLKLNNSGYNDKDSERLKKLIKNYKNIYIIAETLSRDAVNGLIDICDVAISLHRSEGLGLLCEEAMFYGKPVIATGWSGNMDFMTEDTACLVDYKLIPVGKNYGGRSTEWQKWADPDVEQAAKYMKRLVIDKNYYDTISKAAKKHIRNSYSPEICGQRMKKRLTEISDMLRRGYSTDVDKVSQVMVKVCVSCFQNLTGIRMTYSEQENLAVLWKKDNRINFNEIAEKISTSSWGKNVSNTEFIKDLYTKLLYRIPKEEEIETWLNNLVVMDRTEVVLSFLKSDEFLGDYDRIYKSVDEVDQIFEDFSMEQDSIMTQELQQINLLYDIPMKSFEMIPEEILSKLDGINNIMAEELHQANLLYAFQTEEHEDEKVECKRLDILVMSVVKWLEQYNAHVIRYLNSLQEKSTLYVQNIQALSGQIEYNAHVTRYLNEVQKKITANEDTNRSLQQMQQESIHRSIDTENTNRQIVQLLSEIKEQIDARNNELKEYIDLRNDALRNQLNVENNELKEYVSIENDGLKNQLKNVVLEFDKSTKPELNNVKDFVDLRYNEIKASIGLMGEDVKNYISIGNERIQLNNTENKNTLIEVDGSRHNQVIHYLTEIIDSNNPKALNNSVNLIKEAIREKWMLVDSYEQKTYTNHQLSCPICNNTFETDNVSRLVSECIFNGGRLVRYICPHCGVVFGPEKMLLLNDETFSNEYKIHYSAYSEGDATQREIQVFKQLNPDIDGVYLDWGVGAWSTVILSLREDGYQVYGYDPYAPIDCEYVITNETQLRKMKFDGIFSHDLLEHLKDPIGTFKLFSEILKPEGRMVHSTACYDYVYEYTRFHLFFYTGTSIEEICRQTGFEIDSMTKDPINMEISYVYRQLRQD